MDSIKGWIPNNNPTVLLMATLVPIVFFLLGKNVLARIILDIGMISFNKELAKSLTWHEKNQPFENYSLYAVLTKNNSLDHLFQSAYSYDENDVWVSWGLARYSLATKEPKTAARTLLPVTENINNEPLLYIDTIVSLSRGDYIKQSIDIYQSNDPPVFNRTLRDTLASSYYKDSRESMIDKVVELRTYDLYANYIRCKNELKAYNYVTAEYACNTLTYFPLQAISPNDERLLKYIADIIPVLLAEDIWDDKKVKEVVNYLVWNFDDSMSTEDLIKNLVNQYPEEEYWRYLLGELYQRNGEYALAKKVYLDTVSVNPSYAPTYLRLGMLSEAECSGLIENCPDKMASAYEWYLKYFSLLPDDIMGIRRLSTIATILNLDDKVHWQELLDAKTDDKQIVTEQLGIALDAFQLGENQVRNPNISDYKKSGSMGWNWVPLFNEEPFYDALFVGGFDDNSTYSPQVPLRIQGFWINDTGDKDAARGGYWMSNHDPQTPTLHMNTDNPYIFTFDFRTTDGPPGMGRIWHSTNHEVFWGQGFGLPETGNQWRRFIAIGWNVSNLEQSIRPHFESWAAGNFEFANIQFREIILNQNLPNFETIFLIQ